MFADSVDSNHQLIENCRNGIGSAQAELFRRYSKSMYHVSWRIVQNREDAEDILQDSFIDAFQKINSFRGEATFGAWMKRIVINKSINFVKKKRPVEIEVFEEIIADDTTENNEQDTNPDFSVEQVKLALSKLSEGYRIIFTLYMFEDFSHKQIAEQLGITESTSKSQLNRAKKRLSELLMSN